MCCAQVKRSESVPLTMPRMSSKSDGRGRDDLPEWPVGASSPSPPLTTIERFEYLHLLSATGCVKLLAGWGTKSMIRQLLAAALALLCAGCASVTRGTTENISISTTPSGATAEISGLDIPTACVTPCVVQAKRNADIMVTINKEGYEPQTIPLTKEIPGTGAAGFAGNALLGGLVGMGVDAYTGAAQDHKPNPVIVTLQPLAPVPPRPERPRPKRPPPTPQS